MLHAITATTPFVLGTRYGPGVEMDKDVHRHIMVNSSGPFIVGLFPQGQGCLRVH